MGNTLDNSGLIKTISGSESSPISGNTGNDVEEPILTKDEISDIQKRLGMNVINVIDVGEYENKPLYKLQFPAVVHQTLILKILRDYVSVEVIEKHSLFSFYGKFKSDGDKAKPTVLFRSFFLKDIKHIQKVPLRYSRSLKFDFYSSTKTNNFLKQCKNLRELMRIEFKDRRHLDFVLPQYGKDGKLKKRGLRILDFEINEIDNFVLERLNRMKSLRTLRVFVFERCYEFKTIDLKLKKLNVLEFTKDLPACVTFVHLKKLKELILEDSIVTKKHVEVICTTLKKLKKICLKKCKVVDIHRIFSSNSLEEISIFGVNSNIACLKASKFSKNSRIRSIKFEEMQNIPFSFFSKLLWVESLNYLSFCLCGLNDDFLNLILKKRNKWKRMDINAFGNTFTKVLLRKLKERHKNIRIVKNCLFN